MTRSMTWLAAVATLTCLTGSAGAQDSKHFPDPTHVVMSLDVQALLKSKTFAELKNVMKTFGGPKEDIEEEIRKSLGTPITNIKRVAMAMSVKMGKGKDGSRGVNIITFEKAVKVEDILAAKKSSDARLKQKISFEQIKVADAVIYETEWEYTLDEKAPPTKLKGESFALINDTTLLISSTEWIKEVLERGKPVMLSKNLQAGLALAKLTDPAILVVDIEGMPEELRADVFRGMDLPGIKQITSTLHLITLKATEDGKLNVASTFHYKDAASASEAEKAMKAGIAQISAKLKEADKVPPEFAEMFKGMREALEGIKTSSKENQVTLQLSIDPRAAIGFFMVTGTRSSAPGPDVPPTKEVTPDPKK